MRVMKRTDMMVWCERGDNRYPISKSCEVNHINLKKKDRD